MATTPTTKLTEEEYLELERASETRHEYLDGEVFAMVGATRRHNEISMSAAFILYGQVSDRDCSVYTNDMRVKVSATGLYTYPDITVTCGKLEFDHTVEDILLNPTVVIEVLSPSTEAYDRGEKFRHYGAIPALQEYVLISQNIPRIERYLRQADNQWLFTDAIGLDAVLELPSIGCTLVLSQVYKKVRFGAED